MRTITSVDRGASMVIVSTDGGAPAARYRAARISTMALPSLRSGDRDRGVAGRVYSMCGRVTFRVAGSAASSSAAAALRAARATVGS
jgi:hypothetical protein